MTGKRFFDDFYTWPVDVLPPFVDAHVGRTGKPRVQYENATERLGADQALPQTGIVMHPQPFAEPMDGVFVFHLKVHAGELKKHGERKREHKHTLSKFEGRSKDIILHYDCVNVS